MPSLVELAHETNDWHDVKQASLVLWKASQVSDMTILQNDLRNLHANPALTIIDIHTGMAINRSRKGIVVHSHETIVIAF